MTGLVRDILTLLGEGWVPYEGAVDQAAYDRLGCPDARRATWFQREATWWCLGCKRRCLTADPAGFQLSLVTRPRVRILFADLPMVTADELLRIKRWLRVPEAAFCLNVSEREVRYMVDAAKLDRHPDAPLRVSVESVRREMERVGD